MGYSFNDTTTDVWDFSEFMNTTEEGWPWTSELPFSDIYLPVMYFLIFFTGVSGNVFVIVVMNGKSQSRRLVDTFVTNLALADLVFVFTLPFWAVSAANQHRWDFGDDLCKLSSYVIAVNRFSNVFFLTCMSVDRYLAVVRLLDSRYLRTGMGIRVTCAVVWASSLLLGIPSLVYRRTVSHDGEEFCLEDRDSDVFLGLNLTTLFLAFALPLLVILFCYGSILLKLRRHRVPGNSQAEARRRHSLRLVLAIVAAFVLSWLPFNVFKGVLIGSRLLGPELSDVLAAFLGRALVLSSCLAFFNSCANPIIYLLLDRHFRRRAWDLCLRGLVLYNTETQAATATGSTGPSDSQSGSVITRSRLHSLNLSKPNSAGVNPSMYRTFRKPQPVMPAPDSASSCRMLCRGSSGYRGRLPLGFSKSRAPKRSSSDNIMIWGKSQAMMELTEQTVPGLCSNAGAEKGVTKPQGLFRPTLLLKLNRGLSPL
ncbi:hypothetical protein JZ751_015006 [Albula glossodonta]|uniref:G-protein coupled receptors family 1 profile domain-containing protein n=1 Tax=Albula glossodonta TaxID=121402 RepID=A0A8T2MXE2_9TELE|nr:hypothetical protein JZ751_015006 [Albula glossodonta]